MFEAEERETYCLILRAEPSGVFPLQEIARILSGALSVPVQDTAGHLRRNWGLLHKTGSVNEARRLSQVLAGSGFGSFILSSSNLKTVPPLKVIKKALPASEGLIVPETGTMDTPYARGRETVVPWTGFSLVCAGGFFEEVSAREGEKGKGKIQNGPGAAQIITTVALAAAGVPSFGKLKPSGKKVAEAGQAQKNFNFYLDLISVEGLENFRICGDGFDYTFLGGRKEQSALLNFRKMVPDVLSFIPGALRNRGARAIEERASDGFKYGDRQEYEGERFWLYQMP